MKVIFLNDPSKHKIFVVLRENLKTNFNFTTGALGSEGPNEVPGIARRAAVSDELGNAGIMSKLVLERKKFCY